MLSIRNIFARVSIVCPMCTKVGNDSIRTHFGYEEVGENKKSEKVAQVFSNVANRYDMMNDAMSGGFHRCWKDTFVSRLNPPQNVQHIDVAGGTGDIAFRILQWLKYAESPINPIVTANLVQASNAIRSKCERTMSYNPFTLPANFVSTLDNVLNLFGARVRFGTPSTFTNDRESSQSPTMSNTRPSSPFTRRSRPAFTSGVNDNEVSSTVNESKSTGIAAVSIENSVENGEEVGNSVPDYGKKYRACITVVDINQDMINVGIERAKDVDLAGSGLRWVCGDAETLPIESEAMDSYSISFGIRNCTHIDKVLEEAFRVLRPGGRIMCLEFSPQLHTYLPGLQSAYDWYSFNILPVLGQVLAGDYKSYRYLAESIRMFPDHITFESMIEAAGFRQVTAEPLSQGVAFIHTGVKPLRING